MLTILLHSSKTMVLTPHRGALTTPVFLPEAQELSRYLQELSADRLQSVMHISAKLAEETHQLLAAWQPTPTTSAAVETFRGDIYSGLRALEFTEAEQEFAQRHLRLLSGLYGIVRPYDYVAPYRLEAGYRLPDQPYTNLYKFWGSKLAATLPKEGPIMNLSSKEYEKLLLPFIKSERVITPKFLSRMNGGEPRFVAVHAKIARGAFARWMIQRSVDGADNLEEFRDLGYRYNASLSTSSEPVFICDDFQGLGLSQRLVS